MTGWAEEGGRHGRSPWWWPGGPGGRTATYVGYLLVVVITWVQTVGTTFAGHGQPEARDLDVVGYALLASSALVLAVSHRVPVLALWVALSTSVTYWLLDYPRGPVLIAAGFAYVNALKRGHRAAAWMAALFAFVGLMIAPHLVGVNDPPGWGAALATAAWLIAGTAGIEAMRTRREQLLAARRARRERAQRQASEERLNIARELHDVLAHNISLINVQAGVALHLMDRRPEQARIALTAIKEASHGALDEVRAVLGALRQEGEDVPRSPASTLERLDDLVSGMTAAGIELTYEKLGDVRPLPPNVDLAGFRIVQEALTNVARHSGSPTATVRVRYEPAELELEILDEGHGAAVGDDDGNGIAGMRERASALGGELLAGPRPTGGFRVWARLPIGAQP